MKARCGCGIAILQDISGFQAVIDEPEIVKGLTEQLDAVIESSYDGIYITDGKCEYLAGQPFL